MTSTTAIHKACWAGNCKVVSSNLGDKNVTDEEGRTPLMIASSCGHQRIVKVLLEAGVHVNKKEKNGFTALHLVAGTRAVQIMKMLLNAGADPNRADLEGQTPLHVHCASRGHFRGDLVSTLLECGAGVNYRNCDGQTPLQLSVMGPAVCQKSDLHVVKILLENGAAPNRADDSGATALHSAVFSGPNKTNIVQTLLRYGANPLICLNDGLNSLELAASFTGPSTLETAKLLLAAAAESAEFQESLDQTLRYAIGCNNKPMVNLLLGLGADRLAKTKKGSVAKDLVIKTEDCSHEFILNLLDGDSPSPREVKKRRFSLTNYFLESRRCLTMLARRCDEMTSATSAKDIQSQLGDFHALPQDVLYYIATLV